jgi:hypothetical protein
MATPNQIQANRQNALRSTGPRTPAGKIIASRNATRHGFFSTSVLLPHEDRGEFLRLGRRLVSAFNPCGVIEEELVKTIIETHWQLRRANVVDSELFQIYESYKGQKRGVGTAFAQDALQGNAFTKLTRYHGFFLRKLRAAQEELYDLKAKSERVLPLPQPALLLKSAAVETVNSPALEISSRPEIKTEPSADKAMCFAPRPLMRSI